MIINVLFNDFVNPERFLNLQNNFASYHEAYKGTDEIQYPGILAQDFSIVFRTQDEQYQDDYTLLSFQNDFLKPKIANLATVTIEKIKGKIERELQYNEKERANFIKITKNQYFQIEEKLNKITYLPRNLKESIDVQLGIVLDYISTYNFNLEYSITEKIQFNMNKTDVLVLFHLLREARLINHPYDSKFGSLIDQYFQFKDSDTDSYLDIAKSGKFLNDVKNESRTVAKSIERLKTILQSDSFFNH